MVLYIPIQNKKGLKMKIYELSKSAVDAVREYETYLEEVLPSIKDAVATKLSKEGHRLELLRTYGSFKGFSILLVSEDPSVAQLVTSYVVTFELRDVNKLGATQVNLTDFTLDEIYEIQKLVESVLNKEK